MNDAVNKPNIVFILADDLGPWAMRCAGNSEIITPNLDRLANEGMRFTDFFCTSPVCSPARASLLTGRTPSAHGVHDWIREGNVGRQAIEYLEGQLSYTDLLAEHGYYCALSGKWHLGNSLKPQKGFTHWYAHQTGGSSYYEAPMIRDGELVNEPGYLTDVITDDALHFLSSYEGKAPFYLSVHYTAPHSPWVDNHPQHYVDLYKDCSFESCPQEPPHPWSLPSTVPDDVRTRTLDNLRGYFAAVTAMDHNIGRIIDQLEQMNLRENTLICFTSDNGFSCGHHGFWGKGNGTFPQNMYDSSIKVPFIMSHPGRISQGAVCEALVSGYDFMPTLLDYVGIPKPEGDRLPGTSFVPLIAGEDSLHSRPVIVFDEYGPVRMIRSREWKYVHRYPYGPHELYYLIHDPEERTNRIDDPSCREVKSELKGQLEEWFVRYTDPRLDGTHEPVTGKGQLHRAGPDGQGLQAFHELE